MSNNKMTNENFLSDLETVRQLQERIQAHSEVNQGYVYITFTNWKWTCGYVTIRLAMSGGPEWDDVPWDSLDELIDFLKEVLVLAMGRQYVAVCPGCGEEISFASDVTIEDHGVCYDCHHEILNGERCWGCKEVGHTLENCPLTITL